MSCGVQMWRREKCFGVLHNEAAVNFRAEERVPASQQAKREALINALINLNTHSRSFCFARTHTDFKELIYIQSKCLCWCIRLGRPEKKNCISGHQGAAWTWGLFHIANRLASVI